MIDTIDFYPTPMELVQEMLEGVKWHEVRTVLEPSAGSGNIAEYARKKMLEAARIRYRANDYVPDIDCVEISPELRSVLKGKGFRVIHDDFLSLRTYKHYDLIAMNPPFSAGAKHLLKALEVSRESGRVICLLNAETLRNPCTNERKELLKKLDELDAKVTYKTRAFSFAERRTDVEIAAIDICLPETKWESTIYEKLRRKAYAEMGTQEGTEVASGNYIEAAVTAFNLEVESGLQLIREYQAMINRFPDLAQRERATRILDMAISGRTDLSTNAYVTAVRSKYWDALFDNPRFTGNMTSNLLNKYRQDVSRLAEYDFTPYNIKELQLEMQKHMVEGVHECITKIFDELSYQHAYDDELKNNIHYYNGWKTNKSWFINRKVIIPWVRAFSEYSGQFDPSRYNLEKLGDIEKALVYLDGGQTPGDEIWKVLEQAKSNGESRKIHCRYFDIDFFKKGTAHIVFRDPMLLKKLNLYGSQRKGWLPKGYGKKPYADMNQEEKAVVDSAEGRTGYEDTCRNYGYYHFDPTACLMAIAQNDEPAS